MKPYVIAVDIGTTSTKSLVVDREGRILGAKSVGYPLHTPQPGAAEQDPEQQFEAVLTAVREAVRESDIAAEEVLCVTFSSAMHSLIAIDRAGRPLTASITWADQRSQPYAERLKRDGSGLDAYLRTGTPIHPMSPLVKLMWLQAERPGLFASAAMWLGIKEYVLMKLFGVAVIDYSIASATGMFGLEALDWDEEALRSAGVTRGQLPTPVPTTHRLTGLDPEYAKRMGLRADTPFVVGASDGVLANLGAGVMSPDRLAVTIGTSGAVRTVLERPALDPEGRLFCYALTDRHWVVGGATNNGAIVLNWALDALFPDEAALGEADGKDAYERLLEQAAGIAPGAGGLLFLPLLTGERAPFWNADARGVFFGLNLTHTRAHMLRAALEGVMFQIAAIAGNVAGLAGKPRQVRASGGFARSPLWCQLLADMLGAPVDIPESVESSGLGAAQLGLYAMGVTEELEAGWDGGAGRRFEPNEEAHARYARLLSLYRGVYESLADRFADIRDYQSNAGV